MRSYVNFSPTFWTRGSGKKLRGNADAQVLVMYLITCGHGAICGIFHIALPTIAHETGLPAERIEELFCLEAVSEIVEYDADEELCWVPNSARRQIGETMSEGDKRRKVLETELRHLGRHRFVRSFAELYWEPFTLETMKGLLWILDAPSEVEVASPDAPSLAKPSLSSVCDQEGVQGEDQAARPEPSAAVRSGKLQARLVEPSRDPGHAPTPRKDPLFERIPLTKWFPSQVIIDWVREIGLGDAGYDRAMADVRDKFSGSHDIEWWDQRILSFIDSASKAQSARASPKYGRSPQPNHGKTGLEGAEVIR